ncbi:BTB/POZ protein [Jimgerdemannia flammicorona]|uniref:BTB/POZ protein n=1 Tax=Jimgerdemannia flammicorona TaxID=994334 RepID=A0A433DKR5_9FUNG|nr:BTB/POZ protein [Jimgerdemannia flammicorona]
MSLRVKNICFEWEVPTLDNLENKPILSPIFHTRPEHGWRLRIDPFGIKSNNDSEEDISVFLYASNGNHSDGFYGSKHDFKTKLILYTPERSHRLEVEKEEIPDYLQIQKVRGQCKQGYFYFSYFNRRLECYRAKCNRSKIQEELGESPLYVEVQLSYDGLAQPVLPRALIQTLDSLFLTLDSDVEFEVDGEILPSRKDILAERSDYFRAMFQDGFQEGQSVPGEKTRVIVTDVEYPVFSAVLWYLYTGFIDFNRIPESALQDLLRVADMYQINDLKTALEDYIVEGLSPETVGAELFESGSDFPDLKDQMLGFLAENFDKVRETKEFNHILENHGQYKEFGSVMKDLLGMLKVARE